MKKLLTAVDDAITTTALEIHKHPILLKLTLLLIGKTGHRLVNLLVVALGK